MRFSTSFSEEEISFLDGLLRTLIRGGDATMFVRNKAFANVMRKVLSMREKVSSNGMPPTETSDSSS
jgi:hypothetical protein